jgi:YVTN family beta-propeller protein
VIVSENCHQQRTRDREVCISDRNTVSAINGMNNVVSGVTVGSGTYAVAINTANTIYVANQTDGTVSVINGATNTVSTMVTVGPNPYALTVNPYWILISVSRGQDSRRMRPRKALDDAKESTSETVAIGYRHI